MGEWGQIYSVREPCPLVELHIVSTPTVVLPNSQKFLFLVAYFGHILVLILLMVRESHLLEGGEGYKRGKAPV